MRANVPATIRINKIISIAESSKKPLIGANTTSSNPAGLESI